MKINGINLIEIASPCPQALHSIQDGTSQGMQLSSFGMTGVKNPLRTKSGDLCARRGNLLVEMKNLG